LCDRVAIMAEGRLRCVGTSADIKRRFGEHHKLTIHTASRGGAAAAAVAAFVRAEIAAAATPLAAAMGGTTDFELPRAAVALSAVFRAVEARRAALGITHWAVSEATLEEVFLKVSQQSYRAIRAKRHDAETAVGAQQHEHGGGHEHGARDGSEDETKAGSMRDENNNEHKSADVP
jgi:hypothetical protein